MSTKATVSVVIPAYNHAAWIASAIQSVLSQTYTDWELIIIDDASSDQTWEIIQTFQHPQLRCERHTKNQGASATLNQGLNLAQGDYLAILNSDDRWHPQRLERLIGLAQAQGVDFIASSAQVEYSHQHTQPKWQGEFMDWYQNLQQELYRSRDFLTALAKGNFLLTTSNFLFRRAVWEQLKGFADWRYVHDYDFALRVCDAGFLTAYSPEVLLAYRQHDTNTIHESPLKAVNEHLQMLYARLPQFAAHLTPQGWHNLSVQLTDLQNLLHGEWCAKLHQSLVQKEQDLFAVIAEREELIAKQQQWVDDRDGWIKERDQIVERQNTLISQLEAELHKIRQSLGYKIGRGLKNPLLAARHLLVRQDYA